MPALDWFNENRNRAFPFVAGSVEPGEWASVSAHPVPVNRLPVDAIVDAGFVLGADSHFDAAVHSVYLYRVWRTGSTIYFEFAADSLPLSETLIFSRSIYAERYTYEDSEDPDLPSSESISDSYFNSVSDSLHGFDLCTGPLWSGYLVTGDLATLVSKLHPGDVWEHTSGDAIIEPALIYNRSQGLVSAVNLANDDRTRATGPVDCAHPTWSFQTGVVFINGVCLRDEIHWQPGYNCVITQDLDTNSLTIAAGLGAGSGQPCEDQVPLFPGEVPPLGAKNNLLDGSFRCNEVLRTINGLGGPLQQLIAGDGVSILPDPENHRIVVDVSLQGLAVCSLYSSESIG